MGLQVANCWHRKQEAQGGGPGPVGSENVGPRRQVKLGSLSPPPVTAANKSMILCFQFFGIPT